MTDGYQELNKANARYRAAQEGCPHWDYTHEPEGTDHACCQELRRTRTALIEARKSYERGGDSAPTLSEDF